MFSSAYPHKLVFASCTWSSTTKTLLQIRYIGKIDRRRFGLLTVTGFRLNTLVVWPSQANEAPMKGLRRTHRMTDSLTNLHTVHLTSTHLQTRSQLDKEEIDVSSKV